MLKKKVLLMWGVKDVKLLLEIEKQKKVNNCQKKLRKKD
jgi:hypothetical protein